MTLCSSRACFVACVFAILCVGYQNYLDAIDTQKLLHYRCNLLHSIIISTSSHICRSKARITSIHASCIIAFGSDPLS